MTIKEQLEKTEIEAVVQETTTWITKYHIDDPVAKSSRFLNIVKKERINMSSANLLSALDTVLSY